MTNNLLLVNNTIRDIAVLQESCLSNVSFVLYDEKIDTYSSILQRIQNLNVVNFSEVGFIFEQEPFLPTFKLVDSQFEFSRLANVNVIDPELDSFSELRDLMKTLKTTYGAHTFDFFNCYLYMNPNWQYVFNTLNTQLEILIQASTNQTGNVTRGGDWVMESNGVDIRNIYFNENIKNYNFTFNAQSYNTMIIQNGIPYGCGNGSKDIGINTTALVTTLTPMSNLPTGTAIQISTGGNHTVVLFKNGSVNTLYACGMNDAGQLGNNSTTARTTLIPMTNLPTGNPIAIATGYSYTVVLFQVGSTNKIYCCGNNSIWGPNTGGVFGNNSTASSLILTEMTLPTGVGKAISIACGHSSTFVLFQNGSVNKLYACGHNKYSGGGVLGIGSFNNTTVLTPMILPSGVGNPIHISCGTFHTTVMFQNGSTNTLYVCGSNTYGQCGIGSTTSIHTLQPMLAPTGVGNPITVYGGGYHSLALYQSSSGNNKISSCGYNPFGGLGNNTASNSNRLAVITSLPSGNPIAINGGVLHSVVVFQSGSTYKLYACGYNASASLGIGNVSTNESRVLVPMLTTNLPANTYPITLLDTISVPSTPSASAPSAPTSLSASNAFNGQVTVSFTAGSNGGSAITSYQYSTNGGSTWTTSNQSSPITITGLTNNTTYSIKIRAINSVGDGTASAAISVTPLMRISGVLMDGYIQFATITVLDLSNNVVAGPVQTDAYGNYQLPVTLNPSTVYVINCIGGTDIATNLPSLYPLTNVIQNTSNGTLSSTNVNITPLTTIVTNIATSAIIANPSSNPSTLISNALTTVSTALGISSANIGLDYITAQNVSVGVAAVQMSTLTNLIAGATSYSPEQISQAISDTIANSSGTLTVDSTFVSSVITNSSNAVTAAGNTPPTVSSTLLDNVTALATEVATSMNNITSAGGDTTSQLTSLFKISVGTENIVSTTDTLSTTPLTNVSSLLSTAATIAPIGTIVPLLSTNICFAAGTKIVTDQGIKEIQNLNESYTINKQRIVMLTKTMNRDNYMVFIQKNALYENVPNEDTYISGEHAIVYNKQLIKAKDLMNGQTVIKVEMQPQIIYNVLLETDGFMLANNIVSETLSTRSPYIDVLKTMDKMSKMEREFVIDEVNRMIKMKSSA